MGDFKGSDRLGVVGAILLLSMALGALVFAAVALVLSGAFLGAAG